MTSQLNSTATPTYTLAEGGPIGDPATVVRLNRSSGGGLVLLQDTQLIETLAHFARERIPERVVHAKAAGAFGTFTVTHDISSITSAKFLNGVGKKTEVVVRISTVGPEKGSADTARDPRGWGIKFYTEEGNQDWVFNNTPIFFIRDPIKFPSLNRSHKRHPQTNLTDSTMFWDFHNNNQEGTHELMHLFSDRGTPKSLRHTDAFSGHTYKFTTTDGNFHYVKIHLKTDQGIQNFKAEEATKMAGENPDHNTQDLFESISKGDFPTWTAYLQVMTPSQAETYRWNIFDMTKVWPHADFPLIPFGKLELNRNPSNYFSDIEQAAFSPSTMVPGIAPSADPMLQARMFSYPDAARYRLGVNYQLLPPNHAHSPVYSPYQRDGFANFGGNYGADPNYVRTSFRPVKVGRADTPHEEWSGRVAAYTTEVKEVDFVQARGMWEVFGRTGQREAFVGNVAGHLRMAEEGVRKEAVAVWAKVDEDMAKQIEAAMGV
ncbi:Heme-dependent catalase-like protein [Glarea lozoyensis ATCC 20868]|uniref:Heme-dependent catalase-like protein n=1 Tax=Glarea lozoyensis (strain ATCC 20868 / MF5171) TaxID=1116229 RepID=S3DLM2_GLAL2|nr:Heme-dependent catalase-like protein [Glarea lozoyensis ATCC 20868]EPE32951.1 Heme-dependent catalase-like protein [Glarea lozoyensis ATCC 20868]